MVGPGGHYPEWGNPITKELKWYVFTDKWILAQIPKNTRYNLQNTWNWRRTKTKVWSLCPFLELETITHGNCYRDKVWSWDKRMDHLETAIPDPSHNQPPNADTIAHTSKILLKGPWYSCVLWDCRGLANTEVDAHSQLLDGSQGSQWRS